METPQEEDLGFSLTINPRHVFFVALSFYTAFSIYSLLIIEVFGAIYPIVGIGLYALLGFGLFHEKGKKYRKLIIEQVVMFKAVLSGATLLLNCLLAAFIRYYDYGSPARVLAFAVFAEIFALIGYFFMKYGNSLPEVDLLENDRPPSNPFLHVKLFSLSANTRTIKKRVFIGAFLCNIVICVILLAFVPVMAAFPFYFGTIYNGLLFAIPRYSSKKYFFIGGAFVYNVALTACLLIGAFVAFIAAFVARYYFEVELLIISLLCCAFAAVTSFIALFLYRYFWFSKYEERYSSNNYKSNIINVNESQTTLFGSQKAHYGINEDNELSPKKITDLI
ncbi:hypothetical protein QR680_008013 [Steinernema hermaphroditum]|uniref:Uncharacterized protein n=1 Tax=Steinernema hermaphroditum TaxID=289476 RepID=A0AA39IHE0_9BILA|nr:hypothetical protein QR680_008013 [Steinernema hermaphroditum]